MTKKKKDPLKVKNIGVIKVIILICIFLKKTIVVEMHPQGQSTPKLPTHLQARSSLTTHSAAGTFTFNYIFVVWKIW